MEKPEDIFYKAFKKSGNVGYFMLYQKLKDSGDGD